MVEFPAACAMTNRTSIWPVKAMSSFLPTDEVGSMGDSLYNTAIIQKSRREHKGAAEITLKERCKYAKVFSKVSYKCRHFYAVNAG